MQDEQFDAIVLLRRDLGSLLRTVSKNCGPSVLTYLADKLTQINSAEIDQEKLPIKLA
jgi:hypothetical protein